MIPYHRQQTGKQIFQIVFVQGFGHEIERPGLGGPVAGGVIDKG